MAQYKSILHVRFLNNKNNRKFIIQSSNLNKAEFIINKKNKLCSKFQLPR